ncbi:FAD/NAD(P)-binding domain-containing protein [Basidiobolus meristosporus CBS 931.73]|uniref:FAD/NAD(P)-binding domain-containing protein n=1 Tax=Basidiobolus meristosporus CBS 931.73 TaxID=1314790 RepID=A0A1Y1XIB2_9FUNG|nr:FAD/NAD(P)-binding domain-containing protein [Basidiobolus meristosporus CBS 931.73]|eukprot:ORX85485.1 FAD/NAD(P)-binding domain-containing protein [Basidiobolus meristosporus CBS 931.73]
MTLPPAGAEPPFSVMIIGAGLGGLTMAILLQEAGIDYQVYERSSEVRALGSATNLGPNVLPLFEQLGLLDELYTISKPSSKVNVYRESMRRIGIIDYEKYAKQCGYVSRSMARPDLHALLLSRVPKEKVHLGKKVLSIEQDSDKVSIHCADGSTHTGDILIGSDGAYSKVRHSLYEDMKSRGILPKADDEKLTAWHMSVLGITGPMDPQKYPVLLEPGTRYESVIGKDKPNTWRYFTIPGNRICWRIDHHLAYKNGKSAANLPEWGTQSRIKTDIPESWHNFPIPIGGTMGDLIKNTPEDTISKVVLEEKLYETWHHGRVVLIGDSCHKMLPNSGRGAVNAMLDAVILTNALFSITGREKPSSEKIAGAFEEYYQERYPHAVAELERSRRMARVVAGQSWFDTVARKVFFCLMPERFQTDSYSAMLTYRPQLSASILPQVPERGTHPAQPQRVSKTCS